MRVLVGCECSQVVTAAFRVAGHEAFSCDILPSYGNLPQFHLQGDLREVYHFIKPELFIAHPPCTYLSNAGARHLYSGRVLNNERYLLGLEAREFLCGVFLLMQNISVLKILFLVKCINFLNPRRLYSLFILVSLTLKDMSLVEKSSSFVLHSYR